MSILSTCRAAPKTLAKAGSRDPDRPISIETVVAGSLGAGSWTLVLLGGLAIGVIVPVMMAANRNAVPSGGALALGAAAGLGVAVLLGRDMPA